MVADIPWIESVLNVIYIHLNSYIFKEIIGYFIL